MRVRTAAAALSLVVALTGCDGEGNGSSPTHETPTSVPSSTASPATTLPPEATTGPSAATLGDTTEPPTAPTTIGTSTTAVVPAGYQWWDASPDGFAVAVPEAWVIHGALDAETMQQLGVDPEVIALEAPLFLAYNPANRDEALSVGVFPSPGTGMYEEIVGVTEAELRTQEDDLESAFPGTKTSATLLHTAEGYPVLYTSTSGAALPFTMRQCLIAAPGGPEFLVVGMMEGEHFDVVLGSFTVIQGLAE